MSSRFRRSLITGITCTAVLLAAGLGATKGTTLAQSLSAKHAAAHAKSPTNVYFILNWLPNVEFAGLWVAEHFHWWEKAGIHMTYKGWTPTVNPEVDVPNRGGDTFGFQSGAAIAIAISKHVPIKALYTDTQKTVFGLTVLASSNIHKITDLKGKKIGYQPHELYVPETMLACKGLLPGRDYRTVPVSFDITQLTAGNVDAYETFLTNEPIALALQGVKTRSFSAYDYCFHFYDDVLLAPTALLNSNPALVRTVTGIVAKGFKWAHSHPQQAARITTAKYFPAAAAGKGVSAAQNLQQQTLEIQAFKPFSQDAHGQFTGLMNTKTWSDSINILYRYKEITTKPSASSIFTNAFNPYR